MFSFLFLFVMDVECVNSHRNYLDLIRIFAIVTSTLPQCSCLCCLNRNRHTSLLLPCLLWLCTKR